MNDRVTGGSKLSIVLGHGTLPASKEVKEEKVSVILERNK